MRKFLKGVSRDTVTVLIVLFLLIIGFVLIALGYGSLKEPTHAFEGLLGLLIIVIGFAFAGFGAWGGSKYRGRSIDRYPNDY